MRHIDNLLHKRLYINDYLVHKGRFRNLLQYLEKNYSIFLSFKIFRKNAKGYFRNKEKHKGFKNK